MYSQRSSSIVISPNTEVKAFCPRLVLGWVTAESGYRTRSSSEKWRHRYLWLSGAHLADKMRTAVFSGKNDVIVGGEKELLLEREWNVQPCRKYRLLHLAPSASKKVLVQKWLVNIPLTEEVSGYMLMVCMEGSSDGGRGSLLATAPEAGHHRKEKGMLTSEERKREWWLTSWERAVERQMWPRLM